ncbi:hypothetical protein BpHYR1_047782 [Brachionus plicatilis]|uniref:Uncharacterized protein n=1 Tax=Brachionus plicatilis TaxID=10195 RepID=A0A3M7T8V4_BRAPC|nr:hypothetical protein BpHYR1_047782 [Brachionus plicatilis]
MKILNVLFIYLSRFTCLNKKIKFSNIRLLELSQLVSSKIKFDSQMLNQAFAWNSNSQNQLSYPISDLVLNLFTDIH